MKIFFEKKNRRQDEMNQDSGKRDIKLIQKSLKMVKIAQQKNEMLVLESIKTSHENIEKTQKVFKTKFPWPNLSLKNIVILKKFCTAEHWDRCWANRGHEQKFGRFFCKAKCRPLSKPFLSTVKTLPKNKICRDHETS